MVPATRRRATLWTMLAVSNTMWLCYEYVLMLPRPQTNHSQATFLARSLLVMARAVQSAWRESLTFAMSWPKKDWVFVWAERTSRVDLGFAYKTDVSAETFTHYIAESQHQSFLNAFSKSNFYILMDGFTDAGNVKDELVLVQTGPRMILYKRWDHVSGISHWRF